MADEIVHIRAKAVLNEFDYHISFSPDVGEGRLAVIYAENGRGKTNLLRAISFMLSPTMENIEALIEAPVREIVIEFASGGSLRLMKEDAFRGGMTLSASACPSVLADVDNGMDPIIPEDCEESLITRKISVEASDFAGRLYRRALRDRDEFASYLDLAQRQTMGALFIADTRLTPPTDEGSGNEAELRHPSRRMRSMVSRLLEEAERTLSRSAFEGLKRDSSAHGVYVDIAKRTLSARSGPSISNTDAYESMVNQVTRIITKGKLHEKYGLISLNQARGLEDLLNSSRKNGGNNATLYSILNPYLENLERQIDHLDAAVRQIDTFVSGVNQFLERKRLVFSTNTGIALLDGRGAPLDPNALSSGERHLLALMSHAVISTADSPLVIIDEPEISLGLDWQRMLLTELLNVTAGSNVKFLVASHSVQIMGFVPQEDIIQPTHDEEYVDADTNS